MNALRLVYDVRHGGSDEEENKGIRKKTIRKTFENKGASHRRSVNLKFACLLLVFSWVNRIKAVGKC